mmetsp:Transcript_87200/g.244682  ORF Transcript_87200/g.244682 Transcript_87200/m.244682 type:complete len:186 (-) Transcript_87200:107-664(-)|eukprot:CAMPEP_0117533600 /NCGR_PEP_ID=MMETSP0784-20121206/39977_1 /TAXON_ID=39447 /ORGANISM="" /LENGTH=185 /DNA_ID=CAMNT_0005330049 /DNA_START=81 /DNA_END=638 /DNA_ORIENTATION=-
MGTSVSCVGEERHLDENHAGTASPGRKWIDFFSPRARMCLDRSLATPRDELAAGRMEDDRIFPAGDRLAEQSEAVDGETGGAEATVGLTQNHVREVLGNTVEATDDAGKRLSAVRRLQNALQCGQQELSDAVVAGEVAGLGSGTKEERLVLATARQALRRLHARRLAQQERWAKEAATEPFPHAK